MADNNHETTSPPAGSDPDADWQAFLDEHEDEFASISRSKDARKFEKKVRKSKERLDSQGAFSSRDFKNSAFVAGNPAGPRTFSTPWLDADEANDHFDPPTNSASLSISLILALVFLVLGVVLFILALNDHARSGSLSFFCALALLLALGLLIGSLRSARHHASPSDGPVYEDGARV